jgi:hypothetical protein
MRPLTRGRMRYRTAAQGSREVARCRIGRIGNLGNEDRHVCLAQKGSCDTAMIGQDCPTPKGYISAGHSDGARGASSVLRRRMRDRRPPADLRHNERGRRYERMTWDCPLAAWMHLGVIIHLIDIDR